MAIQGKLVPQDPNDEPASVLLERIREEKERLIAEGKIKKEKNPSRIFRGADNTHYEIVGNNPPVSIEDEIPFEIPESWAWTRASSLGFMIRGKGIKRNETAKEGCPCIRYGEIYTTYDISFTETISKIPNDLYKSCIHLSNGDLVFTLTGENKTDIAKTIAYLGKKEVAAGGDLAVWTSHRMNPIYLVYYMLSPFCIERKRLTATGSIIVHISTEKVGDFLVPIPPRDEQNRIVTKINELELFIAQYDHKETELTRLNADFPEALKKSILQEAVMGKLVPQDPNDEPASVLLERIRAEKERLIAEGKIKRDKNESRIYKRGNSYYENQAGKERCLDDELPFEIPESWTWVRLGNYSEKITDQVASGSFASLRANVPSLKTPDYAIMVKTADFSNEFTRNLTYTTREGYEFLENSNLFGGELILSNIGSIGKCFIVPKLEQKMTLAPNSVMIRLTDEDLRDYLYYFILSPQGFKALVDITSGTAMKKFNKTDLKSVLIPVPPLAEQKRIVASIEIFFQIQNRLSRTLKI